MLNRLEAEARHKVRKSGETKPSSLGGWNNSALPRISLMKSATLVFSEDAKLDAFSYWDTFSVNL